MNWNHHNYYADKQHGLISKLTLDNNEKNNLKELRKKVRERIKKVFQEAVSIAKENRKEKLYENKIINITKTKLNHLKDKDKEKLIYLIDQLDDEAYEVFTSLEPRFWTQGSFQYDTLNRPFQEGQEMDIDDGTYLPMPIFDEDPKVGHELLILLVDTALLSLERENSEWIFSRKKTCGRIKIPSEKTHIDVPMYAIPIKQFMEKQVSGESMHLAEETQILDDRSSYKVDTENVNLALREGEKKWTNSDPKIVEDWFNDSCDRIGEHVKPACRFMKSWRDAQWDVGGPSSISLMAAVVNILNTHSCEKSDLGDVMKVIAKHIPHEFKKGIESPDETDEKHLFPRGSQLTDQDTTIIESLEKIQKMIESAENESTKENSLKAMNKIFGERVTNPKIIISKNAAPAFKSNPSKENEKSVISSTMISG